MNPVFPFGDGPAAPRDHRRSTSHGFDQHQTKRLRPIDREQESVGISKESGFSLSLISPINSIKGSANSGFISSQK